MARAELDLLIRSSSAHVSEILAGPVLEVVLRSCESTIASLHRNYPLTVVRVPTDCIVGPDWRMEEDCEDPELFDEVASPSHAVECGRSALEEATGIDAVKC